MDPVESKVKGIISKIIKIPVERLANDADLVEKYGMDSLSRVEVLAELEREFDIMIDDSVAMEMRNVEKCFEVVKARIPSNK